MTGIYPGDLVFNVDIKTKIASAALKSVETQNEVAREALRAAKTEGLPPDIRQAFLNLSYQISSNASATAHAASRLIR